MSRTTSNTSAVAGTATNGLSRNLSIKTTAKSTHFSNPLPPSDIKLFVTNLRLIDLDLRPDWPGITVQTFSSKNADQKQRISGVEWALFRLFEIWDPVETSQKLQPFFPPLEPLQSLNLRAALYRCLNELKKNGVLGRETVLRKTMLDECKGDKFFEVLAFFSNSVLKKTLAAQLEHKRRTTVARTLSTATSLNHDKQASLLPLALAHKAALVNVLRKKEEKRRKFAEFEATLGAKKNDINQRLKQCKATPRTRKSSISDKEVVAIKKQLKDNWIGNQKWLDTMLHGDDVQAEDAFLSGRFQDVWHMVQEGQRLEDAAPEAGLLENLQFRVQEQQARLQKWKNLHETMLKEKTKSSSSVPKAQVSAKEFRFDDHLQMQLHSTKASGTEPVQRGSLRPEYRDIVSDMEAELSRIAKAKHNRSDAPQLRRRASSLKAGRSPERRKKSKPESSFSRPAIPANITKPALPTRIQSRDQIPLRLLRQEPVITPIGSDATLVGQLSTSLRTASPTSQSVESTVQDEPGNIEETPSSLPENPPSSPPPPIRSPSPSPQPTPYIPSEPLIFLPPTLTHEEAIAEAIISSIGNATPSPMKKPQPRLSLADRTRMSMARTTSFPPITESPPSDPSPFLPVFQPPTLQLDRRATLHERTMLSMASMATTSRQSLAPQQPKNEVRKSSSRTSLYPVNQFDTPRTRKSIHIIEESRVKSLEVTPKEELFSDDVDYERIFKSRPRIATSPIFSPALLRGGADDDEEFDEGVTGVDLGDVDADSDEDEGFSRDWENSPSRKGRVVG